MIPYAILSGHIIAADGSGHDIRILELSPVSFTFRTALSTLCFFQDSPRHILLTFFCRDTLSAHQLSLKDFKLQPDLDKAGKYWFVFRVTTDDPEFRHYACKLSREYLRYISLKLEDDNDALSAALTGWTAPDEKDYPASLSAQRHNWFSSLQPDENWLLTARQIPEVALCLDSHRLWSRFLEYSPQDFYTAYWADFCLTAHPLSQLTPTHIYIGNQFCPEQFPDADTLLKLIRKAIALHLKPVVVFAPVPEHRLNSVLQILDLLKVAFPGMLPELIVNDYGLLSLLNIDRYLDYSVTAGILLCRHLKDPRNQWSFFHTSGTDSISSPLSGLSLFHRGVSSISLEANGNPLPQDQTAVYLHLPFYQTNTATFCTLASFCGSGQRGLRSEHTVCPAYCETYGFLYPDPLRMTGAFNSLFGLNIQILSDSHCLRQLIVPTLKRLVISLY